MYFPKSQIETNLYANPGEFVYEENGSVFSGHYFKTSDGKYYTGKSPQDKPNLLLIIPSNIDKEINKPSKNTRVFISDSYLQTTKGTQIYTALDSQPPIFTPLQITDNDYQNGKVIRYFCKKSNELIFIEINKSTYSALINNSAGTQYQLYIPFQFEWVISGNREFASDKNFQTLTNLKIPGIVKYFQNNYTEYFKGEKIEENLNTDGSEFINRKTGRPYTGPYHIHPSKGPMVGAKHVSYPHDYLDYITSSPITGSNTYTPSIVRGGSFGGGGGGY